MHVTVQSAIDLEESDDEEEEEEDDEEDDEEEEEEEEEGEPTSDKAYQYRSGRSTYRSGAIEDITTKAEPGTPH